MRKIWMLGLCVAILLVVAISAMADTVILNGGGASLNGYFVGPIPATLDGDQVSDGGMACLDITSHSSFGQAFDVTINTLPLNNPDNPPRFGSDATAIRLYEEAAWLLGQIPSNSDQVANLQFAVWKIFDANANELLDTYFPGWDEAAVAGWLTLAAAIDPNDYDFSSVRIYTPTSVYAANQEFMSGCAVPVPAPSTILLMGSGLVGLVGLGWRRKGSRLGVSCISG